MNRTPTRQAIVVSSNAPNQTLPLDKLALFNETGTPVSLVQSSQIREIVVLTQAAYDAIAVKKDDVLYYVVG